MEQVLTSLIEAIFVVMGAPDTSVRQCSLAMDKWEKLQVPPIQTMLGLIIDTNRMTVSVPADYIKSIRLLINSTWHTQPKSSQESLDTSPKVQTGSFTYLPTSMHP